ncbi:IS30 family transposase, partial [Escherichia coli]
KRAVAHLTLSEREEIRAGLSAKMSIRAIATALNRSPSTISREVQRNRGRRYYKAVDANNRANRMAKTCLAQYTQHELDLVAAQLNNRPRKTLKFKTPKEIIERGVALTD